MQLFLQAEQLHCVEVDENDLVQVLKQKIAFIEGVYTDQQVLSFHGQTLDDDEAICDTGLSNLSTIDVLARVVGGKVHGSLARAGKVKGQTPKVDAQEKKKKKTGRAHRRQQYNRKFVNMVTSFGGRRRGPNCNS